MKRFVFIGFFLLISSHQLQASSAFWVHECWQGSAHTPIEYYHLMNEEVLELTPNSDEIYQLQESQTIESLFGVIRAFDDSTAQLSTWTGADLPTSNSFGSLQAQGEAFGIQYRGVNILDLRSLLGMPLIVLPGHYALVELRIDQRDSYCGFAHNAGSSLLTLRFGQALGTFVGNTFDSSESVGAPRLRTSTVKTAAEFTNTPGCGQIAASEEPTMLLNFLIVFLLAGLLVRMTFQRSAD
jgi:hypothetical protein